MHGMQAAARVGQEMAMTGRRRVAALAPFEGREPEPGSALARAVELIDAERPLEADLLLTAELLGNPRDGELWLAAGIARIKRGRPASAAAALRMCSWLSGDPLAEQLIAAIEI